MKTVFAIVNLIMNEGVVVYYFYVNKKIKNSLPVFLFDEDLRTL
jgi:hypothetical protein